MDKSINLFNTKDKYMCFEMLGYCYRNFGNPSTSTWELTQLSKIVFYNEKYYTMFILYWGDKI